MLDLYTRTPERSPANPVCPSAHSCPDAVIDAGGRGKCDFNERHATFDESASKQTALAEEVAAILVAENMRLFRQIERLH